MLVDPSSSQALSSPAPSSPTKGSPLSPASPVSPLSETATSSVSPPQAGKQATARAILAAMKPRLGLVIEGDFAIISYLLIFMRDKTNQKYPLFMNSFHG
jgi:hypothetical protein